MIQKQIDEHDVRIHAHAPRLLYATGAMPAAIPSSTMTPYARIGIPSGGPAELGCSSSGAAQPTTAASTSRKGQVGQRRATPAVTVHSIRRSQPGRSARRSPAPSRIRRGECSRTDRRAECKTVWIARLSFTQLPIIDQSRAADKRGDERHGACPALRRRRPGSRDPRGQRSQCAVMPAVQELDASRCGSWPHDAHHLRTSCAARSRLREIASACWRSAALR